jgi:hypothetical protein
MSPVNSILEDRSRPTDGGREVSLAQIAASGIAVNWDETLAIVQRLCQTLGEQPGHPALDWATVFIQSTGEITIQSPGSSNADASVQALGELLRTWLGVSSYPMPLSLVVAQATSTPPFYRSVAELSEALSHYERPNRLELIRNVYEHWQSAEPAARGPLLETRPALSSAELRQKVRVLAHAIGARALSLGKFTRATGGALLRVVRRAAVPADKAPRTSRWMWWAIAVMFLMAMAGWLIVSGIGRPAATTVTSAIGRTNDRLADRLASKLGGALNWLGTHHFGTPVVAPTTAAQPSRPTRTRRRSPAGNLQARGDSTPAAPVGVPDIPVPAADQPTTAAAELATPPAPLVPAAPDTPVVYSAADADVTPPVAIDLELPASPPSGAAPQNGAAVDIVVDETGRVESATLARRPGTLQETMLATMNLSVAKTWRFRPALKAGQPVKYRRTVWLANK